MKQCTEKCKNYKAQKPPRIGRYAAGQKRCQFCEVFIQWEDLYCPCCNSKLRCGPRSREGKEKYQLQITV
jgi:hypothetical protein